jgi:hypothetical protein
MDANIHQTHQVRKELTRQQIPVFFAPTADSDWAVGQSKRWSGCTLAACTRLDAPFLAVRLGRPYVHCSSPDLDAIVHGVDGLAPPSDDVGRQALGVAFDKHTKQIIEAMALPIRARHRPPLTYARHVVAVDSRGGRGAVKNKHARWPITVRISRACWAEWLWGSPRFSPSEVRAGPLSAPTSPRIHPLASLAAAVVASSNGVE